MNISSNYVSDILDEIALEGLDGITLDGLWKRLSVRPHFCFKLDEKSKSFIWKLCIRLNDLKFYELPQKRKRLQYYDFINLHREQQEANIELDEVYPYASVKNENGEFGSCQHYTTRKDITEKVNQMDVNVAEELFADTLVIVASQECRNIALLGNSCPPNLDFSKSRTQYDILERIGRSRGLGVTTHGKGSLQSIVEDSKSIFHYLKFLNKHKIVKKQPLFGSLKSNPTGSRIYLMRHFGEYLNEYQMILQTAIEELKCRPNYRMPFEEFYQLFDPEKRARVKKCSKTTYFRKYIMISQLLPYRDFFPNASPVEWEKKYQGGEKMIRCFQLLDPNTDVTDVFEKDCDSDDEENVASDLLDTEIYYKGIPVVNQAYHHVKNSGSHGIMIGELSKKMGLSKSFIRTVLRRLIQDKHCNYFEEISGRRHIMRYLVGENSKNIAAASEIFQILSESPGGTLKGDEDIKTLNCETEMKAKTDSDRTPDEVSSSGETDKKMDLQSLEEENVPYRTLRRIGMIIKTIKSHRYRLFFQIYKHILEEEAKEGLKAIACRMTVNRILQKLEKDGLINVVDLTMKDDINGNSVKIYMEPSFVLDEKLTDTLLHTHSAYRLMDATKDSDDENIQLERQFCSILLENLTEMKKMLQNVIRTKIKIEKIFPKEAKERELTTSPKFLRLNIIHDLMFHLVYDYTGISDRPQEELLQELSKTCEIDDELKKEMPKIYGTQLTSYLFVPPVKEKEDSLKGWFLISDLLIRLPLSIFVKILRTGDTTPELISYLNHPIRRHFLIKDLPLNIRRTIFHTLKCMVAFSNDIKRLCFLGLVQFGIKCGKEQYQTLLYLNRKATLLDTTSSPAGYLCVPSDMKFPIKQYEFRTKADIKKYWQDMCRICLATNLGVKANMIGKEVVTVREMAKEPLRRFAEPKTPSKVKSDDNGLLPGDHLGAGGIDSVMFSFLRSNWIGPVTGTHEAVKPSSLKKVPLQKLKREFAKKKQRIQLKKSRLKKLLNKPDIILPKPILHEGKAPSSRVRKVKERESRFKKAKKTYYDEVDIEALKLKNTLRVSWTPAEDHLLLICQVAMLYLCPTPRGLVRIPWSEVRYCLQKNLIDARNKTQKAIARRVKYMMKNPTTRRSVDLCLEELKQIPEVAEKFKCTELMKSIKPSAPNLTELQNEIHSKYHALIDYLKERFSKGSSFNVEEAEEDLLPDTLEDFRNMFEFEDQKVKQPLTLKYIRESVIRTILMSSLSCRSDKTSSAIQLFEIYRQYEDDELHRAIKKLNCDKVLAVRKYNNTVFKNGKYLPLSNSPCKLSFSFQILLNMKYSHNLYPDSYKLISELLSCEDIDGFQVDLNECNVPLYALACINLVNFRTTIPEQIIVLDSGSTVDEDAYAKMLKRYCEILQFSNAESKLVCTSGQLLTAVNDPPVETKKRAFSHDNNAEETVKKLKLETTGMIEVAGDEGSGDRGSSGGSWRVVLYMMREEAKKEINNFTGSRAQDFFVVNASQIKCHKMDELDFYAREMDQKVVNALIKNIISRYSVPLSLVSEETVYKEFVGKYKNREGKLTCLKNVLEFIYEKRELGVTNEDLRTNFSLEEEMPLIIQHLVDSKIVIRTGIEETRYIGQKYSTPWLLNSFKVTRLEREKMKPCELSAVELSETIFEGTLEDPAVNPPQTKKRKKGIISSEDLKSDEYVPPTCSMEESNQVKMLIRPWIRIDGSLNRKVLDRFLGTILGYIMVNPAITIKSVMNKFAPSFLPVWTKELIEILHNIGCISFKNYWVKKKATLFTNEEVVCVEGATCTDDDDCVIVEAKIDAIITLGLFIGKRSYSKDFLMD